MSNRELLRRLEHCHNSSKLSYGARHLAARIHGCVYGDSGFSADVASDKLKVVKKAGGKPTLMSFTKFVEYLKKNNYLSLELERLPELATYWGERYKPKTYTFEVVTGDELVEAYRTGPGSCMSGDDNVERVRFYAKNGVELVKIYEEGSFMGRALLWTMKREDTGETVKGIDRVYPSDNGAHTVKVREWAKEKGYLTRGNDSAGDSGFVDDSDNAIPVRWTPTVIEGMSPYFDTFRRYGFDGKEFFFYTGRRRDLKFTGDSGFDATYGHAGVPWIKSDAKRRAFNIWEGVETFDGYVHPDTIKDMIETEDGYVFPENIIYCNYSGDKVHLNNTRRVELNNGHDIRVSEKYLITHPKAARCHENYKLLPAQWVEVEAGLLKGYYAPMGEVAEFQGRTYCAELGTIHNISRRLESGVNKAFLVHTNMHSINDIYLDAVVRANEIPTSYKQVAPYIFSNSRSNATFALVANRENFHEVWEVFCLAYRKKYPHLFDKEEVVDLSLAGD